MSHQGIEIQSNLQARLSEPGNNDEASLNQDCKEVLSKIRSSKFRDYQINEGAGKKFDALLSGSKANWARILLGYYCIDAFIAFFTQINAPVAFSGCHSTPDPSVIYPNDLCVRANNGSLQYTFTEDEKDSTTWDLDMLFASIYMAYTIYATYKIYTLQTKKIRALKKHIYIEDKTLCGFSVSKVIYGLLYGVFVSVSYNLFKDRYNIINNWYVEHREEDGEVYYVSFDIYGSSWKEQALQIGLKFINIAYLNVYHHTSFQF